MGFTTILLRTMDPPASRSSRAELLVAESNGCAPWRNVELPPPASRAVR